MCADHLNYIEEKRRAWQIFDRIYRRYDLLNHLLSFGFDFFWRKKLARFAGEVQGLSILDLATGTGDVLFAVLKKNRQFQTAFGVDMSFNMLKYAVMKSGKKPDSKRINFIMGDANRIPVRSGSFDCVTMAFGIRNISDPLIALKDMERILDVNGQILILEFSLPENRFIKAVHLVYLRYFLPAIGKMVSGDPGAYRYLNKTIEKFPYGDDFLQLMTEAGFTDCMKFPLTLGTVTIYRGMKRSG